MSKRFVVVVLDSFGIGAMSDVNEVRPQDIKANTVGHLLEINKNIHWDNLFKLGLINALGKEIAGYKMNPKAVFGRSNLAHFGADTFFGHQEILGTNPSKPVVNHIEDFLDEIESDLITKGYDTERYIKDKHQLLCVNKAVFIGDNLETDSGQAINVIGSFDLTTFDEIKMIGKIVRKHVFVSRVIAFGGRHVTFNDLVNAIEVRNGCIGIDAPKSGVYNDHYQVVHIGYGVEEDVQLPNILHKIGITSYLYGKVADIVENPYGILKPGVDTESLFDTLIEDIITYQEGFFILNIQETDLAGHAQNPKKYIDRVNVADIGISKILNVISDEDILVVMADHGNDPTENSSKHSREMVPLLIYRKGVETIDIGLRKTLADVGATAADFFGTRLAFGTSFLNLLN